MFEEALAAFRKDWVVLALAYQEKQNQSEGVEGNLGPFWLISWRPISPDWTPQRGGPQYTCHPPIIAFSLYLSPFQFPFLYCQILWQKRFELWWVSLLQLLPPHTTSWSQQCLYSHPVASCYEILLFSGRDGLCPHTCSHPHTHSHGTACTILNSTACCRPTFTWCSPLHFKILMDFLSRASLTYVSGD